MPLPAPSGPTAGDLDARFYLFVTHPAALAAVNRKRTVRTPTFSVEVITLPVSDVERALRFYVDQVGFTLDVDYSERP